MHKDKRIKAVLEGNDAAAMAVYKAVSMCLGASAFGWEPETIRMELDDEGINILPENFDALMAVITLRTTTDFWWDANVFENVCVALNGYSPQEDVLHDVTPSQIAWAVKQAYDIADGVDDFNIPEELEKPDWFDYEPVLYTAISCREIGMVTVPDELAFARETLEEKVDADEDFVSEVKKAWSELDTSRLRQHPYGEDPIGVQLALMAAIRVHVQDETARLDEQVELLEG